MAAAVDYALLSWIHVEAPMKKEGQVKNTLNSVVVEEGVSPTRHGTPRRACTRQQAAGLSDGSTGFPDHGCVDATSWPARRKCARPTRGFRLRAQELGWRYLCHPGRLFHGETGFCVPLQNGTAWHSMAQHGTECHRRVDAAKNSRRSRSTGRHKSVFLRQCVEILTFRGIHGFTG